MESPHVLFSIMKEATNSINDCSKTLRALLIQLFRLGLKSF